MKFYLASGLQNKEAVQIAAAYFRESGFTHTYDWTKNERPHSLQALRAIGEAERQAVAAADFVAVLLPGGNGTHTELGMALALQKRLYIYSATEAVYDLQGTCSFYHIDGVDIYTGALPDFLAYVRERETEQRGSQT